MTQNNDLNVDSIKFCDKFNKAFPRHSSLVQFIDTTDLSNESNFNYLDLTLMIGLIQIQKKIDKMLFITSKFDLI